MDSIKRIQIPLDKGTIASLKAGDEVLLTGVIYTARDQAHLRISEIIKTGGELPVDLKGQIIYYCGPTPPGKRVIGSCGPTTSGRMDAFTPMILEVGVKGMIGKGRRSESVVKEIKRFHAIYFIAPAGAGAYLSKKVKSSSIVAFEDLQAEAIYRLEVEDFPLVVGVDSKGRNLYSDM